MKRVADYSRVSTMAQANEKTIDSQKADLVSYALKNSLLIVESYADDGYSGELLARPALDRLRDDAKAKKFEAILVHSVDRLSRNHIHAGVVIEELQKQGIEVIFLNTPATDTPEGRLLFDIQSVVAQFEKEKIKERTRRGRLHKARKGLVVGTIPPYGYRYVKKDGVGMYVIYEEEARVVKLIFDLYTKQNLTLRGVRKELLRRNIKPQKGGTHWASSSLMRMIANESYTGTTHYLKNESYEPLKRRSNTYNRIKNTGRRLRPKEEWIPIPIPALISKEAFSAAVIKRETNRQFSSRNTKHSYLLRGMLWHLPCGYKMGSEGKKDQYWYRCLERANNFPLEKKCGGSYTSGSLDETIWGVIAELLKNPQPIARYLKKKDGDRERISHELGKNLDSVQRQITDIKAKEEMIAGEYAAGVLKPEQIATLMNGLDLKRQSLIEKESKLIKDIADLGTPAKVVSSQFEQVSKKIRKSLQNASFEVRREILQMLIEKISLTKQKASIRLKIPSPYISTSSDCAPNLPKLGTQNSHIFINLEIDLIEKKLIIA